MDENQHKTAASVTFDRWKPLPLDYVLDKYSLKRRRTQVLIAIWVFIIAISLSSVLLLLDSRDFVDETSQRSLFTLSLLYPSLFLGTLAMFWLGFEWGFIPVFLSAFVIAFATYMPVYWAMLFGIAFILGIGIYALCYYSISITHRPDNLKSIAFFTTVSLIAALATSLGSFVWSLYHDLSAADSITVWQGWWTGIFLLNMLLVGPFLYLLTPTVERLKSKFFTIPKPKVSTNWIYAAILSVVLVLTLFIIGANFLGFLGVTGELELLPVKLQQNFLKSVESFQIITGISVAIIVAAGLGGIYLVNSWNESLQNEVDEQTKKLSRSEARLRETLAERDLLLKEIHNRVNNNLSLMLALLELQFKNINGKPTDEILSDYYARLRSLAIIYETMQQSESISFVNIKKYTLKLSNRLYQSYKNEKRNIDVFSNIETILLKFDRAVPFAMIVNELIVNSYVHAFDGLDEGTIYIEIKKFDDDIFFRLRDNGVGLPSDFTPAKQETLGMRLIMTLTKQLNGEFSVETGKKTTFTLTFPSKSNQSETA